MTLQTDFICAAVEGATSDGREMKREYIEQIAATYDPNFFSAKIWLEHLRGADPDGLYASLGEVVAVKSGIIREESALNGRLALYVKLAPSTKLIEWVRKGQKVHLSLEIVINFSDTGQCYLVGLGVTDSPASMGTGPMKFSVTTRSDSLFSEPRLVDDKNAFIEPKSPTLPHAEMGELFSHYNQELLNLRNERDALKQEKQALHDQFKQKEQDFLKQLSDKDEEIDDLKSQIPADGYKFRPLITGFASEEDREKGDNSFY